MSPLLKLFLSAVVVIFALLFVFTMFVPPPAAEVDEALRYFPPEAIAAGQRFAFERRLLFWAGTALQLALLLLLVTTGAARRWADAFSRWLGDREPVTLLRWLGTLLLVGATYAVLDELLQFPVRVGSFALNRAWGMTERPFGDWFGQYGLAVGVTLTAEAIAGVGLYLLLRWLPRTWYLWGALGALVFGLATAWLMPIVVAPLFNTFTPLAETRWAALEQPLRKLADEAGVPVDRLYVVNASRQGKHTNAYFTGLGATQSIVLYDTLLEQHPRDEVESILAHEIGHWTHRHIIQGVLLGGLGALVGLIALDRILRWCLRRPPLSLRRLDDPAGLPLVILLSVLGSWVALPLQNAVSRHFERQADRTSLDLAGMPEAFIRAEQRLALDNKGNVVPEPWTAWLFNTHPTVLERIEMAKRWEQKKD